MLKARTVLSDPPFLLDLSQKAKKRSDPLFLYDFF